MARAAVAVAFVRKSCRVFLAALVSLLNSLYGLVNAEVLQKPVMSCKQASGHKAKAFQMKDLLYSVEHGQSTKVAEILKTSTCADREKKNWNFDIQRALYNALRQGHEECVPPLLEFVKDIDPEKALYMYLGSKLKERQNTATIRSSVHKELVDGAEKDEPLDSELVPLTDKELIIVSTLINAGPNTYSAGKAYTANNPLSVAVTLGDCRLLKILLEKDPNGFFGEVNLHAKIVLIAARKGCADLIDLLIPSLKALTQNPKKKKRNRKKKNGLPSADSGVKNYLQQALYASLKGGHEECVLRLLELIKDFDVEMAVGAAAESGSLCVYKQIVKSIEQEKFKDLVSCEAGTKWLCTACSADCVGIVDDLLSAGARPNFNLDADSKLKQPLMLCKSPEIAELLIKYGADVHRRCSSFTYHGAQTAVEVAVVSKYYGVVKVLIKHGSTVDINLLTFAISKSLTKNTCRKPAEIVKLLLSYD